MHTPGPWNCERLIDQKGNPYATHYQAHIDIGVCMVWAPSGNAEQEANARLIAAAPDLLEACKLAFLACQDNMYTQRHEELLRQASDACEAAIEKATTDAAQTSAIGGNDE